MNKNYTFSIEYEDAGEVKRDLGWGWTTPNDLEHDRGIIYDTFITYLKFENKLKRMKKFKILGFKDVVEEK